MQFNILIGKPITTESEILILYNLHGAAYCLHRNALKMRYLAGGKGQWSRSKTEIFPFCIFAPVHFYLMRNRPFYHFAPHIMQASRSTTPGLFSCKKVTCSHPNSYGRALGFPHFYVHFDTISNNFHVHFAFLHNFHEISTMPPTFQV